MTYAKKGPAKRCDVLFSRIVRSRGQCERCGLTDTPFQCAHIIRRRYAATRCLEDNAWCLCVPCHQLVDGNAGEFTDLVNRTIGRPRFDGLYSTAQGGPPGSYALFWRGELQRLLARCDELGVDARWRAA